MRVAITGVGGNLGRAVVPRLLERGHEVRSIDMRPVEGFPDAVIADVRDAEAMARALDGCDRVVHAAALHGIHLRNWTPEDFWGINVTGTFNVFEAARAHGIRKVVLCSTMGVYGSSIVREGEAWGFAYEGLELRPTDVYGLSKVLAEEMGRTYGRQWGVETVALRLGMFVPESSFERYGFRLLFGGVDERDVADAVLRSLEYAPEGGFEAFNVMAPVPFGKGELSALGSDLEDTLERAYPGASETLRSSGLEAKEMVWWPVIWSSERAQDRLGYQPRYGFGQFLEALRRGDRSLSPVIGDAWWGV